MAMQLDLRADAEGVNLAVRVKIRASQTRIAGTLEGQLVVALAAPPVDGEANAELLRFLAKLTRMPRSQVTLVGGDRSRSKVVRFHGASQADLAASLGEALAASKD